MKEAEEEVIGSRVPQTKDPVINREPISTATDHDFSNLERHVPSLHTNLNYDGLQVCYNNIMLLPLLLLRDSHISHTSTRGRLSGNIKVILSI